ncbi:NAD-dependent epimerase/dehydratase family protein [Candidatus Omnitrophota bacterium]
MTKAPKKIFITGGAGFIGTALIERLIENNQIVIYDNFHRNSIKDSARINHPNLTMVEGDVLDLPALKRNIQGSDYVLHLAAIAGVDTVIQDQVKTMKVNLIGTTNVLEAAATLKDCRRFIDFSTSEVFGSYAYKSGEEDSTVMGAAGEARWTYAVSKLAGEHLTHSYYKQFGLPALSIRPFNIYGPGQVGEGAIHKFVRQAIQDEKIEIRGTGDQIRSWCYIDDIIDAILLCLENDQAVGNIFNIGNPQGTITVHGLALAVVRVLNSKSSIRFVPKTSVDVELRIPSIEKARQILGFEPKVDLEQGIKRTADWYRKQINNQQPAEV